MENRPEVDPGGVDCRSRRDVLRTGAGVGIASVAGFFASGGSRARDADEPVPADAGEFTDPAARSQSATFVIGDIKTNAPIEPGDTLEVSFGVTNRSDIQDTQEFTVRAGDIESQTVSVQLVGSQGTTEYVYFDTDSSHDSETTITVSGEYDEQSTTVWIFGRDSDGGAEATESGVADESTDTDGQDGTPEGGGGIGTTEIAAVGGGGGLLALLGGYALMRRRDDDDDSLQTDGPDAESADDSSGSRGRQGTDVSPAGSGGSRTAARPGIATSPDEPESTATGVSGSSGSETADGSAVASGTTGGAATDEETLDIDATLEDIDAQLADARQQCEAREYDDALGTTAQAIEAAESIREAAAVQAPHRVSEIEPVLTEARNTDESIGTEREAYREAWERYQDLSNTYDELAAQADPTDPDDQVRRLGGLTTKLDRVEAMISDHEFENLDQRIATLRENCNELVEDLESWHATIQEARSNADELESALDDAESSLEAGEYGATIQHLDEMEGEIARTSGQVEPHDTPTLDERLSGLRTRWEQLRERATAARGPTTGEPDEIPTAPRLHLDYSDIQRVAAIGTGGNADVYRATVPTPAGDRIDVAVKEPRMGGVLQDQTVDEVPGSTDPTLSPEAFEQPETSSTDIEEGADEHVPGGSGTRAWSRDADIDPDAIDPDYEPGTPATEPAGTPTKIQPGGESESTDSDTRQQGEDKNQLLEEAEKWAKIDDHDHIVNIVDYGDEPLPWIAMEYMDGGHIAHRAGEVDLDQALWIAIATTKAVRHAHRRGVAHLDLKPDNILFRTVDDAWDVPKVADWGLSKLLLNHSQTVAGLSTHYAAPEQFDREFGQADDITDIYQLGSVFYELFTGQRPFEGRPAQVMRKVLTADATPPSEIADLPPALDDILLKALEREKDDRYETVVNLRNDLQDVREWL